MRVGIKAQGQLGCVRLYTRSHPEYRLVTSVSRAFTCLYSALTALKTQLRKPESLDQDQNKYLHTRLRVSRYSFDEVRIPLAWVEETSLSKLYEASDQGRAGCEGELVISLRWSLSGEAQSGPLTRMDPETGVV